MQAENGKSEVEVYKCSMCDFETTHNPGLKSHMTKMHVQKPIHSCDQCSETFETRKKLKNHIYCIHSGKYKTLAIHHPSSFDLCPSHSPFFRPRALSKKKFN
jgi:hypothetical protein